MLKLEPKVLFPLWSPGDNSTSFLRSKLSGQLFPVILPCFVLGIFTYTLSFFFFFSPVSPASQSSLRLQTPISKHPLNVSTWNLAVTLNYTWASPPPCVHSCPSPPIFKTNRTTVHQHVQAQSIVVILKSSFSQFPWAILQQLSIIPSMYSHSSLLLVTSTSSTLVSHLDHCKRPLLVPRPLPLPSLTPWPENAFKTHRGSHHFTAQISSIECKILWSL